MPKGGRLTLETAHVEISPGEARQQADSRVGVKTAETYRRRLLGKVGCNGTAELVRYAVREGILPP
jgi:hypothetical protein